MVVMDGSKGPKSPRMRDITPERTIGLICMSSSSARNSARWNASDMLAASVLAEESMDCPELNCHRYQVRECGKLSVRLADGVAHVRTALRSWAGIWKTGRWAIRRVKCWFF